MDFVFSSEWSQEDETLADAAYSLHFPGGQGMLWAADADTTRDWAGSDRGLSSLDTRIQFKNRAEYKGLERHAWQYLATNQWQLAADYFYVAAVWREMDAKTIELANPGHSLDPGHLKAVECLLRMARFATACARRAKWEEWPEPKRFGLSQAWVEQREERAREQVDAAYRKRTSGNSKGPQDPAFD